MQSLKVVHRLFAVAAFAYFFAPPSTTFSSAASSPDLDDDHHKSLLLDSNTHHFVGNGENGDLEINPANGRRVLINGTDVTGLIGLMSEMQGHVREMSSEIARLKDKQVQAEKDLEIASAQRPFSVLPSRTGTTADGAFIYYGPYGLKEKVSFVFPLRQSNYSCVKIAFRFFALATWDHTATYGYDSVKVKVNNALVYTIRRLSDTPCNRPTFPGWQGPYRGALPVNYYLNRQVGLRDRQCFLDGEFIIPRKRPLTNAITVLFESDLSEPLDNESWIVRRDISAYPFPCS